MADKGNLRRHNRTQAQSVIQLIWKDQLGNEKFTKARTLDVSETGLRMEVPERIPERSYVTFRVDELGLHGTGSVRSCNGKGLKYIVGLEFAVGMKWKPKPAKSEAPVSISERVETHVVSSEPSESISEQVETHIVSR